jgi:hypothetical protein
VLWWAAQAVVEAVKKQHQELSEDPHDFVATHLVRASLAGSGKYFASLHRHRQTRAPSSPAREQTWGVPIDDCHFGGVLFAIRPLSHSVAMMLLTLFDVVVILLTWVEYGKQRSRRQTEIAQDNGILEAAPVQESGGGSEARTRCLALSRTASPIPGLSTQDMGYGAAHFAVASDRLANCGFGLQHKYVGVHKGTGNCRRGL